MSIRSYVLILLLSCSMFPPHLGAVETPVLVASNGMSLDSAIRQVKAQTGGQVLTAETITRNGNKVHRIKVLLPDGTVKVILINAE